MNYIQPNINMSAADFGFQQLNSQKSEKSFADLSFADALKAAYKNDRFASDSSKIAKPEEKSESRVEEKNAASEKSPSEVKKDEVARKDNSNDDKKISKKDESEPRDEESSEKVSSDEEKSALVASAASQANSEDFAENEEVALDLDSDASVAKVDSDAKNARFVSSELLDKNANENDIDSEVDLDALLKSKIEDLSKSDSSEKIASSADIAENTEEFSKVASENVASRVAGNAKGEKTEKNGFEKLSVHDLRTKKADSDEIQSANVSAKSKIAKAEKKESVILEKDTRKIAKGEKSGGEKNLSATPNLVAKNKPVSQNELKVAYKQDSQESVQLTMELAAKASQNITSSSAQAAAATGSDFQHMLSNTVQHNAAEFVKAGNIILKDANQGTINLILKPESLGNVKISLSLSDKTISGQITVASKEAYDAFRESIDAIRQAFTQSGFDTGSFDLNFSNNQQNFAQGGENSDAQNMNQQNAVANADKSYGDLVSSETTGGDYSDESGHVNIVA